ncbi:hypothetical protein HK102_002141 [Quaeritorhiza haematococci]|nr:hypothetical protein HK102_002141 [Quaeritorhiza haematococci]
MNPDVESSTDVDASLGSEYEEEDDQKLSGDEADMDSYADEDEGVETEADEQDAINGQQTQTFSSVHGQTRSAFDHPMSLEPGEEDGDVLDTSSDYSANDERAFDTIDGVGIRTSPAGKKRLQLEEPSTSGLEKHRDVSQARTRDNNLKVTSLESKKQDEESEGGWEARNSVANDEPESSLFNMEDEDEEDEFDSRRQANAEEEKDEEVLFAQRRPPSMKTQGTKTVDLFKKFATSNAEQDNVPDEEEDLNDILRESDHISESAHNVPTEGAVASSPYSHYQRQEGIVNYTDDADIFEASEAISFNQETHLHQERMPNHQRQLKETRGTKSKTTKLSLPNKDHAPAAPRKASVSNSQSKKPNGTTAAKPKGVSEKQSQERSNKQHQQQKREVVEAIGRLKGRILLLDREMQGIVTRSHLQQELVPIIDQSSTNDEDRQRQRKNWMGKVLHVKNGVLKITQQIQNAATNRTASVDSLMQMMESVENEIMSFKEGQREVVEKLLLEEKRLFQDLTAIEERAQAWEQQQNIAGSRQQQQVPLQKFQSHRGSLENTTEDDFAQAENRRSVNTEMKNRKGNKISGGKDKSGTGVLPEVIAFHAFLAKNGGHYGGWEELNHRDFVKLWQKYKIHDEKFIERCVSQLLGSMTYAAVEAHERWYQEYTKLLDAKKLAIERWREQKAKRVAETTQLFDHELSIQEKNIKENAEKDRERREQMKRDIEKWKEEQKLQEDKREQERKKAELRRQQIAEKKRQEQEELRQKVNQYIEQRQTKMAEAARIALELERRKKSKEVAQFSQEELRRLQQRDLSIVEKKREALSAKAKAEEMKRKRLEKIIQQVEIKVTRDPERLLQPTEGFKKRLEALHEEVGHEGVKNNFAQQAPVIMPRRQIPTWRRGL